MWVISNELYHHGIKGQKWGIRRYQNEDGSLTAEGRRRYGLNELNYGRAYRSDDKQKIKKAAEYEYKQYVDKIIAGDTWLARHDSNLTDTERRSMTIKALKELDTHISEKYDINWKSESYKKTRRESAERVHPIKYKIGTKIGHYNRNDNNIDLPKNDAEAEKMGWRKLSTKESAMHQFNKKDGVANSKWVSADGHKEVVFTGKGNRQHITKDIRDEGTYNYYDPQKNPVGHTVADVLPYVFLGNDIDDPTSGFSRVSGGAKNLKEKKQKGGR